MLTVYNQNHDYNQNIHFLHGNSFTPNSYKNLLDGLSNRGIVKTSLLRPLWTKDDLVKFSNWDIFLDDYLDSIKGESNIVGVGHSIGGNLLLKAAIKQPERFDKIILLDPTFFVPKTIMAWKIISLFKMQSYVLPYINRAQNKKMHYNSIEEMFKAYRTYKVFSKFSDEDLLLLVNSLVKIKKNKVELIFDNEWDAQIYRTGLVNDMFIWKHISDLNVQTMIIRAEHSDVFLRKTSKHVIAKNKSIVIKDMIKSDHLFPINNYTKTLDLIDSYIVQ
ncbi:MAG: hypothetical protein CMG47_02780 [Candidatus Marinimicrobia bacterium]|nr:hypothetical protein [Candidatus Neomarinimicrobiota bacterium]